MRNENLDFIRRIKIVLPKNLSYPYIKYIRYVFLCLHMSTAFLMALSTSNVHDISIPLSLYCLFILMSTVRVQPHRYGIETFLNV